MTQPAPARRGTHIRRYRRERRRARQAVQIVIRVRVVRGDRVLRSDQPVAVVICVLKGPCGA